MFGFFLKKNKMYTFYIYCPAASYTGGPTLAHQLCSCLIKNGIKAKMWYDCNPLKKIYIDPVHENYKHFNNPYVLWAPIDSENNVIVALESNVSILKHYKAAKRYIWWMSVDNFFLNMGDLFDNIKNRMGLFHPSLEYCQKYEHLKRYSIFKENDIIHLVQSEYARLFLLSRNISPSNIRNLGDYLEDEVLSISVEQYFQRSEKIVLYNPKKGFEFTSKIILSAPHFEWVPLVNMTKAQIKEKLLSSKIYIDFGNHPGKDRFPREAALCGCCIITGKRGAAENDVDIPIPSKYKFVDTKDSIPMIIKQIEVILNQHDLCNVDFNTYRSQIKGEKDLFEDQVRSIFSKL
jgi:hypothetical protein